MFIYVRTLNPKIVNEDISPDVTLVPGFSREEIVNACGIDDFHDGVNYTRTACVIAVSKARDMFEPFLHQVGPPSLFQRPFQIPT